MNFLEINWAAFAVVFVVGFVFNSLWFGPKTFYPVWWRLMSDRPIPTRENQASSPVALFGLTILGSLVQLSAIALSLQVLESLNGSVSLVDGLLVGLFISVTAAMYSIGHRMFAGHGVKVWLIEVTPDILVAIFAGIVFAIWR